MKVTAPPRQTAPGLIVPGSVTEHRVAFEAEARDLGAHAAAFVATLRRIGRLDATGVASVVVTVAQGSPFDHPDVTITADNGDVLALLTQEHL